MRASQCLLICCTCYSVYLLLDGEQLVNRHDSKVSCAMKAPVVFVIKYYIKYFDGLFYGCNFKLLC